MKDKFVPRPFFQIILYFHSTQDLQQRTVQNLGVQKLWLKLVFYRNFPQQFGVVLDQEKRAQISFHRFGRARARQNEVRRNHTVFILCKIILNELVGKKVHRSPQGCSYSWGNISTDPHRLSVRVNSCVPALSLVKNREESLSAALFRHLAFSLFLSLSVVNALGSASFLFRRWKQTFFLNQVVILALSPSLEEVRFYTYFCYSPFVIFVFNLPDNGFIVGLFMLVNN